MRSRTFVHNPELTILRGQPVCIQHKVGALLTVLFVREVERYLLALEHMLGERRRQRGRHDASDLEEAFV